MKILFISNNYIPYSGGVVSSINATISQLGKEGHEVQLATFDFVKGIEDPSYVKRVPSLIRFRYKTHHIVIPYRPKKALRRIMQDFEPDVVHVHHPFLLGAWGAKIAKEKGIPVVFTYHTQYEAFPIYLPVPKKIVSYYIAKAVARFCKTVDGIIAVGAVVTRFLRKHTIETPAIELASGLQEQFLLPLQEKKSKKLFNLLMVSRFSEEKNIPFLIDVFAELPVHQFMFTLVGFGPLFEDMKHYAKKKGVFDCLVFIEKPSKERLVSCYQEADLFLFSAQQSECQPQVLPEAFSAGLPIVALPGPGPDETIVSGYNGYIVHSKEEMVQTIYMLASNNEQYQKLRVGAWSSAQRFYPAKQVKKLLDFYKECGKKNYSKNLS